MNNYQVRQIEYSALRAFLKIMRAPETTLENKMSIATRDELTPRQREMVELYYIEQMPMKEIAEILAVDISTVSRTIKRAKQRLHRCLKYGSDTLIRAYDENEWM